MVQIFKFSLPLQERVEFVHSYFVFGMVGASDASGSSLVRFVSRVEVYEHGDTQTHSPAHGNIVACSQAQGSSFRLFVEGFLPND